MSIIRVKVSRPVTATFVTYVNVEENVPTAYGSVTERARRLVKAQIDVGHEIGWSMEYDGATEIFPHEIEAEIVNEDVQ